jgi:ADP-ribose pyrophosphatase
MNPAAASAADPPLEVPYEGSLFQVHILRRRGEDGHEVRREVVRHPGAVLIVPALDDGRVVLIRNWRVAVNERLWEFPAGKLERGESPEAAAHRELEEETGYRAATLTPLGEYYTSPGFTDELMHAFLAERLTHGGQRLEHGEEIEVHAATREEVLSMAADGRLRDGKSIAALLLWQRLQQQ